MSSDRITHYMVDLPAVTQHYDLECLYNIGVQDANEWAEHLAVWREVKVPLHSDVECILLTVQAATTST